MDDREHRVAAVKQTSLKERVNRVVVRNPATTYHQENAMAVGFRRLEHIHGQNHAQLSAINDVPSPLKVSVALRPRLGRERDKQKGNQNFLHSDGWPKG